MKKLYFKNIFSLFIQLYIAKVPIRSGSESGENSPAPDPSKKVRIRPDPDPQPNEEDVVHLLPNGHHVTPDSSDLEEAR